MIFKQIIFLVKKVISNTPKRFQQEIKRYYFWFRILTNSFNSDEPEFAMLKDLLQEGDWVIDVGANVGHYSCKFSSLVGKSGRVFSFEPSSDNFEILSSNVNKVGFHNVTLINFAASDKFDTFGLNIPNFNSGLTNYYMASLDKNITENMVASINIDSICFSQPIKMIKIDVEGHEMQAILGMKELLKKFHPYLIVEGLDSDVRSFLEGLGYSHKCLPNSPNTIYSIKN